MKRFLVSCVIYAIFACNILAQTQMNRSYLYNRGYKANIQASVLFATTANFVQYPRHMDIPLETDCISVVVPA